MLNKLPLMKESRDGESGAKVFVSTSFKGLVLKDLVSTFILKTWTVPLSLETASHWAVGEKQRLQITALSEPLLSCI